MAEIKINGFKCNRCGHVWYPRLKGRKYGSKDCLPTICPKCKSANWNAQAEKN